MEIPTLAEVRAKLDEAGGFGDGVDFGSFRPLDALADPGISAEGRESACLVLLSELAEAVDNSTWKEAIESALGRGLRRFLGGNGVVAHERAMRAFFSSESEFFAELHSVYVKAVAT